MLVGLPVARATSRCREALWPCSCRHRSPRGPSLLSWLHLFVTGTNVREGRPPVPAGKDKAMALEVLQLGVPVASPRIF